MTSVVVRLACASVSMCGVGSGKKNSRRIVHVSYAFGVVAPAAPGKKGQRAIPAKGWWWVRGDHGVLCMALRTLGVICDCVLFTLRGKVEKVSSRGST